MSTGAASHVEKPVGTDPVNPPGPGFSVMVSFVVTPVPVHAKNNGVVIGLAVVKSKPPAPVLGSPLGSHAPVGKFEVRFLHHANPAPKSTAIARTSPTVAPLPENGPPPTNPFAYQRARVLFDLLASYPTPFASTPTKLELTLNEPFARPKYQRSNPDETATNVASAYFFPAEKLVVDLAEAPALVPPGTVAVRNPPEKVTEVPELPVSQVVAISLTFRAEPPTQRR